MGSIKHRKTSTVPNALNDTRRIGGDDWNNEHDIDLEVSDVVGLEARLIPVDQVVQYRDDALAYRNEAAGSAGDAADSAAEAAVVVDSLAADDGATKVGTDTGQSVQVELDGRVVRVDTVAALRAMPTPAFRMVAQTAGYASPGDGGGKAFLWVPASAQVDNGGNVIRPDSAPANGRWEWGGPGDARAFGCSAAASAAVNTEAAQRLLDNCKEPFFDEGAYAVNTLTAAQRVQLEIRAQASLVHSTVGESCLHVTAADCAVLGAGKITSTAPPTGTQGEFSYGVISCVADGLHIANVTLDGIPKFGVNLKNCSRHAFTNVNFTGKVPKSFYNESDTNTLNQAAINYDPPASGAPNATSLLVIGCRISGVVQGSFAGNYGATPRNGGIIFNATHFSDCWDHGTYLNGTAADYSLVGYCVFENCRRPIVGGGKASSVIGNIAFSDVNDASMEQTCSMRDAIGCTFALNDVRGYGAGVYFQPLLSNVITDNLTLGNSINATGPSLAGCGIRFGQDSTTVLMNNKSSLNKVSGYPTANFGVQAFFGAPGSRGNSSTEDNLTSRNLNHVLCLSNQSGGVFSRNMYTMDAPDAAPPTVAIMVQCTDAMVNCDIESNSHRFITGGANVTLRGMNNKDTATGCNIGRHTYEFTAPNLAAGTAQPVVNFSSTTNNIYDILLSRSDRKKGTITWPTTTDRVVVTNANAFSYSRISFEASDAAAATVRKTNGVFVRLPGQSLPGGGTVAAGTFVLCTGDAGNTAASSTWLYEIS